MRPPISSLLGILVLVLALTVAVAVWIRPRPAPESGRLDGGKQIREIARRVRAIETRESEVAQTAFAPELAAERSGRLVEDLWDELNRATNKWRVLADFPVREISLPQFQTGIEAGLGIRSFEPRGSGLKLDSAGWQQFLTHMEEAGWQLAQLELRHIQFEPERADQPSRSRFSCSGHLSNARTQERAILEGFLDVVWGAETGPELKPAVARIDASTLKVRTRVGPPGFREVLSETIQPPERSFFIDPVILHDLDGDGIPEVILAAKDVIFYRTATGEFRSRALCRFPPGLIFTALVADFDGDGVADFLCAKFDGLYLFKGSASGTFDEPGRLVWAAQPHLKYGQAFTCGDIDGDGDLDLWLGQYKLPYDRGQMPTPFYEANDGYPSYLLVNDGHGNFSDATTSAGLGQKRWRRTYSASFVDVNGDGHLDLVTASDFAGLELFLGNGKGQFTDATHLLQPDWHGFGMSQIAADFNQDGRLDLLMIGMNVPTLDRLQGLACVRPGFASYLPMSQGVGSGNRLFLGEASGWFRQGALSLTVARTGWSWGCSALDFDNDGFPDLYIANGHETKETVRDYESEFWLHDIYVGNSRDDLAAFAYFQAKQARTRGQGVSYGGYEKNRLLWNQRGESFLEIGYLMGVALEKDSRNVVADDLDGDGRVDLLTTTFEAWPEPKQTLRIFHNELPATGHWIGFQFRTGPAEPTPVGAQVRLEWAGRTSVQQLVAGDSFRSQRSETLRFGLGDCQTIEKAEVRWLNGASLVITNPLVNRCQLVRAPSSSAALPK